jgi:fructose-bisphosphate aldolase class II/tagatose 1,6-diphosphate aldolase GatY/KbaY
MKFVNPAPMVKDAQAQGYAVPAFNTNGGTYDIARASLEAAQECASPLILQVYEPNCAYRGFEYFVSLARFLCDELEITVPVALHLDHGKSIASVMRAIRAGFTGVMLDASHEPLEQNITMTNTVIQAAHPLDVAVEAEVGHVKGYEPPAQKQIGRIEPPDEPTIPPAFTEIEEATRLVKETGVDLLAVSVGTTHGVFKRQRGIDYQLLDKLRQAVSVPLVQHGTGGISLEDLSRLAKKGMAKINFGEPFRYNFINYFYELTDSMEHLWHAWKIMGQVKDRLKEEMKELIRVLGSEGKAD